MISPGLYYDFVQRAKERLHYIGAQVLFGTGQLDHGPPWTRGWSDIMLLDAPGSPTVYAFSVGDLSHLDDLTDRIDVLAGGIAAAFSGPQPVSLVCIIVLPEGTSAGDARRVAGLVPSTFHRGLRPVTVAIDPDDAVLYRPRFSRRPEGLEALQSALQGNSKVEELESHGRQSGFGDFYRLVQGRRPLATYALIAVNAVVYVLLTARGGSDNAGVLIDSGALVPRLVEQGQWWRLLTEMFLHAGPVHILFNMASLFAIGTLAERLYGSTKFIAIYFGAGVIGALVSFAYAVLTGNANVVGVGASGAIFGVAGALVTVRYHRSDVIPPTVRRRVSSSMVPLVAVSLIFAYLTPHVDNAAHVGGLLGGMLLSFFFPLTRRLPAALEH